jgi:hypothetical protein
LQVLDLGLLEHIGVTPLSFEQEKAVEGAVGGLRVQSPTALW